MTTATTLPTPTQFERASLSAWPGIKVEWDGQWVRRASGGYTKRANSLQCFDPEDGVDAERRLQAAIDWFTARNLPPVVRVTPLSNPALEGAINRLDWDTVDHSHLFAMPLGQHEPDERAVVTPLLDPGFIAAQQLLQGYNTEQTERMRAVLAVMAVPAAGVTIYRNGIPAASGLMAVAGGIVLTGNVVTNPQFRRQGFAAAMMRTGLAWAGTAGAVVAALNVGAENRAAQSLYAGLGYTHQYDYSYRTPRRP